ncbi:SLOG family protein [Salinicoccus roseus]|uniref:SLOG family protein n=1 Tax=Salinicoccus roseus TaxID=45670 RepID=UPI001CA7436E|nr:SLOG family protein [Salinicoccus roseus]MBY8908459.1 SLOG family protein [Salinicoccus roseus]
MKTLIAGYRPYELGIFKDTQPEAEVLKQFMREKVRAYAETGTEWFIIQGYTGIEFYAAEAIMDLREEYGFKFSVLKPFHKFDDRYKEDDQLNLNRILEASDFHNFVFNRPYESPNMFRMINRFLIEHSDQALIVFDEEVESKTRFIYEQMLEFQENNPYNIERIQFDEINAFIDSAYER